MKAKAKENRDRYVTDMYRPLKEKTASHTNVVYDIPSFPSFVLINMRELSCCKLDEVAYGNVAGSQDVVVNETIQYIS